MEKKTISTFLVALMILSVVGITTITTSMSQPQTPQTTPTKNIVQTAIDAGDFTTLVTAVKAAGLVDTLSGPGPFTVFAPTDAAFAKLPPGTLGNLLNNTPALKNILLYHVVPGELMAKDLAGKTCLVTAQGSALPVVSTSSGVKVDSATVVKADILCSNGVIHVIDAVMLPPSPAPCQLAATTCPASCPPASMPADHPAACPQATVQARCNGK